IGDGSTITNIDGANIQNGTITGNKIANNSINSNHIIDRAIASIDIALNAITNSELAPNSVNSGNIIDGQVNSADVATNAIGNSELLNTDTFDVNSIRASNGRYRMGSGDQQLAGDNNSAIYADSNNDTNTQMVFRDRQGTQYGRVFGSGDGSTFGLLDGDGNWSYQAEKDTFTGFRVNNDEKMRILSNGRIGIGTNNPSQMLEVNGNVQAIGFRGDGANVTNINGDNIQDGTIDSSEIENNSITGNDIAPNAIRNSELATGAVESINIQNYSIEGIDIAANTITAGKIAANSIRGSELDNTSGFTMAGLTVTGTIKGKFACRVVDSGWNFPGNSTASCAANEFVMSGGAQCYVARDDMISLSQPLSDLSGWTADCSTYLGNNASQRAYAVCCDKN
ncbi:hypothetical protein GW846_05130, partial [Candidatus Gracilibacteria bacterium]|nr:hypothetical protein [Candidatus Gracilibacteria bacterium]